MARAEDLIASLFSAKQAELLASGVISVLSCGAIGNGTTDDTAAIQKAVSAFSLTGKGAIYFAPGKTYRISSITLPERIVLFSDGVGDGAPIIKANSSSAMFTLPTSGENFVQFYGLNLNGNSTAAAIIDNKASSYTQVKDCSFYNATVGIDMTDGGYYCRYSHNRFYGTTTGISIDGPGNAMLIDNNEFEGAQTYCILTGANNTSDSISIIDNYFGASSATDGIKLQNTAGFQGKSASVIRNRFDMSPSSSHINIGRYVQAIVQQNSCAAAITNLIKCDGTNCDIRDNYLASSTGAAISITSNAVSTRIGFQNFGTGGVACSSQFSNSGTDTRIERIVQKNTTANRPTLLACDIGKLYLDTTLDPDGKPIWYNGSAWVDATGAVV